VINTKPFMVIGLSLAILGLGILIWWGFSFVTIRRMRNNLENYQNLEEERGSEREGKQEVEMSKDGKM
jgi:flagellar biosynthesis/type III secretory pathway M-ring protein FliF/YscJ